MKRARTNAHLLRPSGSSNWSRGRRLVSSSSSSIVTSTTGKTNNRPQHELAHAREPRRDVNKHASRHMEREWPPVVGAGGRDPPEGAGGRHHLHARDQGITYVRQPAEVLSGGEGHAVTQSSTRRRPVGRVSLGSVGLHLLLRLQPKETRVLRCRHLLLSGLHSRRRRGGTFRYLRRDQGRCHSHVSAELFACPQRFPH